MAVVSGQTGNLDNLQVKFTHYNTVRDKKAYTIYEIEVRSSSTITWVIYKRYSDFYTLHQSLSKVKVDPSAQKNFQLPHLPPRRLTRSLAAEFVQKRKIELQEYLTEILNNPYLRHSDVVLQFLEVPDTVRPMLARNDASSGDFSESLDLANGDAKQYASKSYEEKQVLNLLNQLTHNRNKVSAIKSFEESFFENRPRLSPEYIQYLFRGNNNLKGLVQVCGDFNYSHVACRAALDLLCRLLDIERNKDAQLFLDIFTSLDANTLKQLQLHVHIISERGNRLGAFRLISVLRSKNPNLNIANFVTDTWARQEYFRWAERKQESVTPAVSEPQEQLLRPINIADVPHRKIFEQTQAELRLHIENEQGWKVVKPPELLLTNVQNELKLDMSSTRYSRIKLMFKMDSVRDMVVMRLSVGLPFDVDTVTKTLIDISHRKDWDLKFHRGKRIEKLDNTSDVAHYVFKSFSSPYKYRDFCLLRSWDKHENGRVFIERSIVHSKVPEQKDHVRAFISNGYFITPFEGASDSGKPTCILNWVSHMDRESVLIVSPDLLGETTQLMDSMLRLQELIETQQHQQHDA